MNYVEKAMANHAKGYNCSQSVACAFCEVLGFDEKTVFCIMEGFGGGMGNLSGICGAVSGAIAAVSMKKSTGCLEKPNSKAGTYKMAGEIVDRFVEMNKSYVCKDLKGIETGEVLRSCNGCIEDAVRLVEELLNRAE